LYHYVIKLKDTIKLQKPVYGLRDPPASVNATQEPPRGRCGGPCDLCMVRPCMLQDDGHNAPPFGHCRCAMAMRDEDCKANPPARPKFVGGARPKKKSVTYCPDSEQVIYFSTSAVHRTRCFHTTESCRGLNRATSVCTAHACKICVGENPRIEISSDASFSLPRQYSSLDEHEDALERDEFLDEYRNSYR